MLSFLAAALLSILGIFAMRWELRRRVRLTPVSEFSRLAMGFEKAYRIAAWAVLTFVCLGWMFFAFVESMKPLSVFHHL